MTQTRELEIGANPADRARNRAMGAGLVDDPHPVFDRLRESGPIHPGAISTQFGIEGADQRTWPDRPNFSAFSWATVDTIMRDSLTYSSSWYEPVLMPTVGRSLIQMDEPDHRRYRALIQPAFTLKETQRWETRWVRPIVERLVDAVRERGRADLYVELCSRVPVHTVASAFGVAEEDVSRFHELAVTAVGGVGTDEERMEAAGIISDYLREIIADRRKAPKDDLISVLSTVEISEEDGSRHRLSDEEILAFGRLMLPAGAGTTYRELGCLLVALLQRPEQLDALRRDRALLEPTIEEGLRWEQPLTSLSRLVTRDTELAGVKIPEGAVVHASLAAANRDPERWDDPHAFDIFRPLKPHATFGGGPHICVGMHVARMELRVAMETVLDRLPNLRLDPDVEAPYITGLMFRMPTGVPVVFG